MTIGQWNSVYEFLNEILSISNYLNSKLNWIIAMVLYYMNIFIIEYNYKCKFDVK